jgi:hypothetical protein
MRNAIALAFALALPFAALAQTQKPDSTTSPGASPGAGQPYGQGGSPHCDKMTGADRAQCLKDEGAKTDSRASSPNGSANGAAAGGTSPSQDPNATNRDRPGTTPSTR